MGSASMRKYSKEMPDLKWIFVHTSLTIYKMVPSAVTCCAFFSCTSVILGIEPILSHVTNPNEFRNPVVFIDTVMG